MRRIIHLGLMASVLVSCASCGQQAKKQEMVRGHVLYQGTALPGGTIVFTPDTELGGAGPLSVAEIKSDGSYSLKTGIAEGAPSGPYRVTIASDAPATGLATRPAVVLPRKYSDPAQAGLKREVKMDKLNIIDFNLD
jgi:hypothetical protein